MSVGRGVEIKKIPVNECWQLDMCDLTKKYTMDRHWQTTICWKIYWDILASIGLEICPPCVIRLYYSAVGFSNNKKDYDYNIYYESTPCNFGGRRWWFRCPNCNRRCRILYLPHGKGYFACRICYNLTYKSQQRGKTKLDTLFNIIFNGQELQRKFNRTRSQKKRDMLGRKIKRMNRDAIKAIVWEDQKFGLPKSKRRG